MTAHALQLSDTQARKHFQLNKKIYTSVTALQY